jgi:hypothetical protein
MICKAFLNREIKYLLPGYFSLNLIVFLIIFSSGAYSQDELDVLKIRNMNWLKHSDISNSLYHHLTEEAYEILEARSEEVSKISSLPDWKERQQAVRNILQEITGPFPEKTALNARITGIVEKDGYRVENIIFESQPGFRVTSSLFIPDIAKAEKAPAVIYCSGHTVEGYRSPTYQHKIINLVKKGFIVFAFDPVGQGERLEYYDTETGRSAVGGPTLEHSYPGAQAFIAGRSLAGYMIWDGIRAVDYLITRPEVDHERIGITGRSGGGTQSAYIAALDERIYAAAPEAYITSFTRLLQSIGPQDAEQNLFNGIRHGIDHADLLAVRAPKPAMIIATTNDFFSIQGAREAFREVQAVYHAYGNPGNMEMVEDLEGHASTRKNREAMYAFFQKHLNNPGNNTDIEVDILSEKELMVTTTGQLSTSVGSETIFSLTARQAEILEENLVNSRKESGADKASIIKSAKELSGYRDPEKTGEPVYTGRILREGYRIEKYFVTGEGDYVIPYLMIIPDNPGSRSLIYLHPEGKSADASPGGPVEWFVREGFTVLVPDLIGTGETGPGIFRGDAFIQGVSYNAWFASMLIGRSITGIRASDVVRLTGLLYEYHGSEEVYALAKAELSPVLLHAAAFEPSISRVALLDPLSSCHSLVTTRFYSPRFIHGAVPGMSGSYDLPDLAASLAPRVLMLANVVDGTGTTNDGENINKELSVIRTAYQKKGSPGSLIIESGQEFDQFFKKWIE